MNPILLITGLLFLFGHKKPDAVTPAKMGGTVSGGVGTVGGSVGAYAPIVAVGGGGNPTSVLYNFNEGDINGNHADTPTYPKLAPPDLTGDAGPQVHGPDRPIEVPPERVEIFTMGANGTDARQQLM